MGCRIEAELHDVDQWLKGNITTDALVASAHTVEWGYTFFVWTLAPLVAGCVYVAIVGCLTHPHKMQGCAATVTLVLASRQAIVHANADAYASVALAAGALVVAAAFEPVRRQQEGSLAEHVHAIFEDVDEAAPAE
jgi:hypothetical protein